jgi:riboflavin kinase/FMN adenylyltransferase
MLVFHFTRDFAATSAQDWVEQVIARQLGAAGVVTGTDFTFGKGRAGDITTLSTLGAKVGVAARAVAPVQDEQGVISSSRIRDALRAGDPATAARLLTRPFTVRGIVQHGDKLGRTIGFPTANLSLGDYLRPAYGVYAITGRLPDGRRVKGAANMGIRPTSIRPRNCWSRISSITLGISTLRRSRCRSRPSCAGRRSSSRWMLWSRRSGGIALRRSGFWKRFEGINARAIALALP